MSSTEEQGDFLQRLDQVHRQAIKDHNDKTLNNTIFSILPAILGIIVLLAGQLYLAPNNIIPHDHNTLPYNPITLLELRALFYLSLITTIILLIRQIQSYIWNIRTIPVQDGDRTREATAIASMETGLGGRLFLGKSLSERYHAPPTVYHNREGITFSSLDQAELLNIMRYIEQQDHLNQLAYKSGMSKYQKLTVNMKGTGEEQ